MTDLTRLGVREAAGCSRRARRRRPSSYPPSSRASGSTTARTATRGTSLDQRLGARVRGGRAGRRHAGRPAPERGGVRREGAPPALTGVPVGLKDLYGVAGKPITASSLLLEDVPVRGLRRLEPPALGGHDPARPPPHPRVRRRRDDRPGRQPVGLSARRGLERRVSGRAGGAHGSRRDGHRHCRVAADPVRVLRHLDHQAHARQGLPERGRAALVEPRPRRADGAHARRLSPVAGGDGRAGSSTAGERPPRARVRARAAGCVAQAVGGSAARRLAAPRDRRARHRRGRRLRPRARDLPPARRRPSSSPHRRAFPPRSATTSSPC